MRSILILFLVSSGLNGPAQQSRVPALPVPEAVTGNRATLELRDAWDTIAHATNEWATSIRQRPEWTTIAQSSLSEIQAQAQRGNPVAQLRLGYCYFAGESVDRDYSAAFPWLRRAADAEIAPAQFLSGVAYLNGWGVARDFEAAVDQLTRAAEHGFADAEFQLGVCFLKGGPGVNQAPARGVKWLARAAEQGKPSAQQFLAWCFASGIGVPEDPEQAFNWCAKAAGQGLDSAQDFLGMFWASGYGTNQDWTRAVEWFVRSARQGLGTAQIHLAQCYAAGRGVELDPVQSLRWWQAAAEQGFPGAQFHVGLSLSEGQGTPKDLPGAVSWFRRAAEQQHVGGQLYLGLCYWKGLGVSTDAPTAQKWWGEAALHGIAHHLPELGDEPAEVEKWWQRVAEQASPRLQCCLAEYYRFGQGVAQSDEQALKWYRRAGTTGDVAGLRSAAWLLATSPKSELRDGRSAIDLARKAAAATKRKDPKTLDALAAAYAESAQFSKAISTENEAIAQAQEDEEKKEYQSRLKLYQARTAFRSLPDFVRSRQLE